MKIFDCHSHWATLGHGLMRSDEDLKHAREVFRVDPIELSDDEQAQYFRSHGARAIFDLSYTKDLPIEEMQAHHDYAVGYQRMFPDVVFGHWLQFQPWRVEESLSEFERVRAAASPGFVGLCVNGQSTGVPASDDRWEPFFRRSVDLGLPIMILCGLTGVGQGHPGGKGIILDHGHPRHIDAVAARHPALRILAARPAFPWQDEMIAILRHKTNVSYELHGWGPRQLAPGLLKEIQGRLKDRVMFGCDFPALRFEKVLRDWDEAIADKQVLKSFMHDNAASYFG